MNVIERFVERLLNNSTPEAPLWNIERLGKNIINGWNYIDGCMMTALLNLYEITGNRRYFDFVDEYISYYVHEDGSILGFNEKEYNVDSICEGRVLFDLYRETGKEKYRKGIETLYSQLLHHPRTFEGSFWHKQVYPNQVWLDGLFMAQVFYTRYTTTFENCKNYEDIRHQFNVVRNRMYDPETKLYSHGYAAGNCIFWAGEDGRSKTPWLRSIGWFSVALVDVLSYLAEGHEGIRRDLSDIARELAQNLKSYIDKETGMLYQVPNMIGREGNYPETSGSSMVAYFYLKGARLGVLEPEYAERGAAIFKSTCERYLTETDGKLNLGGICLMAGLSGPHSDDKSNNGSYEYYIKQPVVENDAKGLAPFLLCYTELLMAGKVEEILGK